MGGEGPGRWGERCGETGQAGLFPLGSTFPSSLCTGALHPNLSAAEVLNSNMELQRERETSPPASGVLVWKPGEHQELAFLGFFFFFFFLLEKQVRGLQVPGPSPLGHQPRWPSWGPGRPGFHLRSCAVRP